MGLTAPELKPVPDSVAGGDLGIKSGESGPVRGDNGRSSGDGDVDLKSGDVALSGLRGSGEEYEHGGETSTESERHGVNGGRHSLLRTGLSSDTTEGLPSGEIARIIGETQRKI